MKKFVRIGVLLLFWGATFALVAAAVHYKKKMELLDQKDSAEAEDPEGGKKDGEPGTATAEGTEGGETTGNGAAGASGSGSKPTGSDAAGKAPKGGTQSPAGSKDAAGADATADDPSNAAAKRSAALFDLPATIDSAEFDQLIEELRTAKSDYSRREAALAERERELERKQQELNERENQVMTLAKRIADGQPLPTRPGEEVAPKKTAPVLDPNGVTELAAFYQGMKDTTKVKDALLAMEPKQAAAILKAMDKKVGVQVLSTFPLEAFQEISAIILANDADRK